MDPLSVATSVYTALDKLKTAIEQVSILYILVKQCNQDRHQLRENQKDVYKLARDLISGTLELTDIRRSRPGIYPEIDLFLGNLTKYVPIHRRGDFC